MRGRAEYDEAAMQRHRERMATRTRCRHCYDDIIKLNPWSKRWSDVESECATCAPNLWHEPMPTAGAS